MLYWKWYHIAGLNKTKFTPLAWFLLCDRHCFRSLVFSQWDSPVDIWMKPKMMMMIRASNLEAVNKSCTLVAALTLMQFTNVREAKGDTCIHIYISLNFKSSSVKKEYLLKYLRGQQRPPTKTQAGDELGCAVGHGAVWVQRFQKVGGKHQRHHVLRGRPDDEHLHPQL